MKNLKNYLFLLLFSTLIFTSCTKEDAGLIENTNPDMAILSFAPILDNLENIVATGRQAEGDIPACSAAAPAYVNIILTSNEMNVVGEEGSPFRIDLVDGQLFTQEVPELELEPGTYVLEYFEVFDAEDNRIWVAPMTGGDLANFVENPLPLEINLGAGVKKYVDVTVLCFDDRMVNEYGYLFFDLVPEVAIEFCIFGNYCDETGRHYPAAFSVSVWNYANGQIGSSLYTDLSNTVTLNNDGDYAGTPLCIALPDREGEDEYYFEITLLDSDAYGDINNRIIRVGTITDVEVKEFFDGDNNLDYYHFREGCENDDTPPIFQDPDDDTKNYKACLKPMNNSGAIGFAYLQLDGNILKTTIMATGLESGKSHLQHIHENAGCDNPGPPIFGLQEEGGTWPVAEAMFGDIIYHRTFTLGTNGIPALSAINPLENRTVNLHGMTVDGDYNAGIVVACGELDVLEF